MSDLFDAPRPGAPRAGVVEAMSWPEFWSQIRAAMATGATGGAGAVADDDGIEWVAANSQWMSPRRPAADEPDDEDKDDDDDDDEDDEDDDDDLDEDDDLDDIDDDEDADDDDDDLDDEDLEDEEFDDDLVDLDDEYDTTEEEERNRGGSDYEPD